MTRTRRQRDALAPSLFPFLAVLLCTMGALVLILMLLVAGAQSKRQEAAREVEMRVEEAETQLELVKNSYNNKLDEGKIELEKERLKLQHFEEHIRELLAELDELKQTIELSEQDIEQSESTKAELAAQLSELEKQLAEATAEWQKKLDKPEGKKPVYAIIPYQGTNGTHRRPIYVECLAEGVVLQPEGIAIPLQDLQPPYGPGNPLDAALRTIRAEFPPSNGAVTSTAYPLLVVRPSGIKSYVMARAAMRGWDDQFGYELIEQDLELAFPEPTAGLKSKVASAIDLARQRQAALVMAMPQRFRGMESFDETDVEWRSDGESGGFGGGSTAGGAAGASGSASSANGQGLRGGFQSDGALAGDSSGTSGLPQGGAGEMGFAAGAEGSVPDWSGPDAYGQNTDGGSPGGQFNAADGSTFADNRTSRGGSSSMDLSPSAGGGSAGDPWSSLNNPPGSGTGEQTTNGSFAGNPGTNAGTSGTSGGSSRAAGQQAADGAAGASGGSMGGSAQGGSASGSSSQATAMQSGSMQGQSSNGQIPPGAQEGDQPPSFSPSLSMNNQLNPKSSRNESASAVSKTRGRNWAWSQGPPTETPVVRSIRVQCLSDRWVLLPDAGTNKPAVTILFDGSPRDRAEQLAKNVSSRVQGWGMALAGGHWKPVLSVDVAPDAEWRFLQLQQLLEGSGLEIQRRETKP